MSYFDDASGELTKKQVFREKGTKSTPQGDQRLVADALVSDTSYTYDTAGNVTSIREGVPGIEERQCFTHDSLGRLTEAWTAVKKDQDCAGTPTSADVHAGGKNDGYWQQYAYDLIGNRTKLVEKDLTGDSSLDATTEYNYGVTDVDTGVVTQPRTLTSTERTGAHIKTAADGSQNRVTIVNEAKRLYNATGDTTSVESLTPGDRQELAWTVDGKVERVSGQGSDSKTPYVGARGECLDLQGGYPAAGRGVLSWTCVGGLNQKWTFTPEPKAGAAQPRSDVGRLSVYGEWCLQPASNSTNAPLQVQECAPGKSEQLFTRTSAGQLIHNGSGQCVAAPTSRTAVVLNSCANSDTTQKWLPQEQTSYIYGPGGSRLLTVEGQQATLHLGEADLRVHAGGALVKATRTYSTPGGSIARAVFASGSPALAAITGDHQGSPYAEVALTGAMDVRIRKQDPFGNQRSTGSTGPYWINNAGFLGSGRDDTTGFVHLGARLYDATVGRFLSADPILDLADPQQANGYTYAHNNPVTHSDPTGLNISLNQSEMAAALAGVGLTPAQVAAAQATVGRSLTSVILSAAWGLLSEIIGIGDAVRCFGGDLWSCGSLLFDLVPWGKIFKAKRIAEAVHATLKAVDAFLAAKKAAENVIRMARAAETAAINAKRVALERAKAAAQARAKPTTKVTPTSTSAVTDTKKTGAPAQKKAAGEANPHATTSKKSSGGGAGKSTSGAGRSNAGTSGGSCNSFVPGTRVLMADGTTKPIEQVEAGDKVFATDPETGETRIETVTAEITGKGTKILVTLTIKTAGDDGATAEITATDNHPFWVSDIHAWVNATDLQVGQWLRTSAGTYVQISAIERRTAYAIVHNLTVANLHTYYVFAGENPVLVHNCPDLFGESIGPEGGPGDRLSGFAGGKTDGIYIGPDGIEHNISSGEQGYARDMPRGSPGLNGVTKEHVEGHVTSLMRKESHMKGTLYINKMPCDHDTGCLNMLPIMLPPGARLLVYGPYGFEKEFIGLPD